MISPADFKSDACSFRLLPHLFNLAHIFSSNGKIGKPIPPREHIKIGPDSGVEPESPPLKGGALPLNLVCETTQGLPLS